MSDLVLPAPRAARPVVWDGVRHDYLSGLPAHECCRRHGVTIAALRARAARQGWRRIDQPWVPPNALPAEDEGVQLEQRSEGDLDRIDVSELGFVAHRRMLRCVLRGDAAGALRWRRVEKMLLEEEAELRLYLCQEEALNSTRLAEEADGADWLRPTPGGPRPDVDPVDYVDSDFPSGAGAGQPPRMRPVAHPQPRGHAPGDGGADHGGGGDHPPDGGQQGRGAQRRGQQGDQPEAEQHALDHRPDQGGDGETGAHGVLSGCPQTTAAPRDRSGPAPPGAVSGPVHDCKDWTFRRKRRT